MSILMGRPHNRPGYEVYSLKSGVKVSSNPASKHSAITLNLTPKMTPERLDLVHFHTAQLDKNHPISRSLPLATMVYNHL